MPVLVIVQPAPLEADWTWMRLGEPGEGPFAMTFLHRWRASPQVSSLVLDGEVGPVWTKSSAPRWGPAASTLTDLGSQREDPYSHGTSPDKLGRWDSVWGSGCAIRYARTGAGQGDGEAASQPGGPGLIAGAPSSRSHTHSGRSACEPAPGDSPKGLGAGTQGRITPGDGSNQMSIDGRRLKARWPPVRRSAMWPSGAWADRCYNMDGPRRHLAQREKPCTQTAVVGMIPGRRLVLAGGWRGGLFCGCRAPFGVMPPSRRELPVTVAQP